MKLICLGTSSGVPTKARNVSGYAISPEQGKQWYLVDCGEGTQHRLLHSSLSPLNLQGIFITHVHGDHCYGLPGLLASTGMMGRKDPLTIYAPYGVEEMVRCIIQHSDMYVGYDIRFVLIDKTQHVVTDDQFCVSATELSHRVESYAY